MEYYLAIKKNEIMPFAATWMDLGIIILSEVNQTNIIRYPLYVDSKRKKKKGTNELISKTESHTEKKLMVTKGERWVEG